MANDTYPSNEISFDSKISLVKELFAPFYDGDVDGFSHPSDGWRYRAGFSIYHDERTLHYAMYQDGKKQIITKAPFVAPKLALAMDELLALLRGEFASLAHRLFEVRFATSSHSVRISLLYHKDISSIHEQLSMLQSALPEYDIVGISRGQKHAYKDDFMRHMVDGYYYEFSDECFIQPNLAINESMLRYAKSHITGARDLLELYCGYGNFSIYLSECFGKVLATELSKKAIYFANRNLLLNDIKNIQFAKLNDKEISQAISRQRAFRRLAHIDLDGYDFSHILLDPPRCGLGECASFACGFEHIIYVSCNPHTAAKDLATLTRTHQISHLAVFDQFVSTPHVECMMVLDRRPHYSRLFATNEISLDSGSAGNSADNVATNEISLDDKITATAPTAPTNEICTTNEIYTPKQKGQQ